MRLLDTSVAVDHLRGHAAATDLLSRLVEEDVPVVASEVVRFELLSGVRDHELEQLEEFCSVLSWVGVDEAIARAGGALSREHRRSHAGVDDADYLIAATALVLDAELLTTNVRHFPMLPDLRPPY